ncbi:MAG: helix-turn-helix domain-containing protein [Proteobacteria bacterium]|nr:helix-turn-helix domain-containing protein [Pseudomonadota bacterium]
MELQAKFGNAVRRIRLAKGLTIEALAQDAGVSYSYLGEIERGLRNPTLAVIGALAEALSIDAYLLLRD